MGFYLINTIIFFDFSYVIRGFNMCKTNRSFFHDRSMGIHVDSVAMVDVWGLKGYQPYQPSLAN